jgi:hypothetical protein
MSKDYILKPNFKSQQRKQIEMGLRLQKELQEGDSKEWRPDKEKWEHRKFHDCMYLTKGGGDHCEPYAVYEAGASAMLSALLKYLNNNASTWSHGICLDDECDCPYSLTRKMLADLKESVK